MYIHTYINTHSSGLHLTVGTAVMLSYVPCYGTAQRQCHTHSPVDPMQITTCMLDILCSVHFSHALLFIVHRTLDIYYLKAYSYSCIA